MWQAGGGGGGGLRALRERFGMHGWAPPTAGVNFVVLGRPPSSDGWVLSAGQIKRVWDARQGDFHNIRWEIETHGIEWMSVACGRQA